MASSISPYTPSYTTVNITVPSLGDFGIHYIEAGSKDRPTILLLHGFPSSSTQYRDLIPLLSDSYHILAPDLPGYGLTTSPANLTYTFDNLAATIGAWLVALNITSYAVYVFDYGAPVAWRLALKSPKAIKAVISQNGNAYDDGFGKDFWAPAFQWWNSTRDNEYFRKLLIDNVLTLPATQGQYYNGFPASSHHLVDPLQACIDYKLNLEGKENQDRQLALFYDYGTNLALYPKIQAWFRESQVPLLAVWGKDDPIFVFPGAEAFKKDLPNAEVVGLDGGHFVLETQRWEVARLMKAFLGKHKFR